MFELDFDKPATGDWSPLFEAEGVVVVEDSIGRPAIACGDAARLIGARRAAHAYWEAERARQAEEWSDRFPVPRGIPAQLGMTAVEVMFAADADERPAGVFEELLDAELAHGKGT